MRNPFEGPVSADVSLSPDKGKHRFQSLELRTYRSPLQRGNWTIIACIFNISLTAILCAAALANIRVQERIHNGEEVSQESVQQFQRTFDMLTSLQAYSAMFASVSYLFWLFRTSKNLRAISYEHPAFTPGWVIACWLVPVANLFWPYRAVVEIWRLSDHNADVSAPNDDRKPVDSPPPLSFRLWWAAWLLFSVFSIALMFAEQIEASWGLNIAIAMLLVRLLFGVFETIFGCSTVVQINRRQVNRFNNLKAALSKE